MEILWKCTVSAQFWISAETVRFQKTSTPGNKEKLLVFYATFTIIISTFTELASALGPVL